MANPNNLKLKRLLQRSIRLARRLERLASGSGRLSALSAVGWASLVRNRRLASAIDGIPRGYSYEALILIRSMLEIAINYSWIRLKNSHSRALRFARYQPIEELKAVEAMPSAFSRSEFDERTKRLRAERAKTRHLFRRKDSQGRLNWAKSWAQVSSFEGRLLAVRSSAAPAPIGNYLYGVYRWISSIVHGGAQSLSWTLKSSGSTKELVSDSEVARRISFALLMYTIDMLAEDLKIAKALEPELSRLIKNVKLQGGIV